MTAPPGLRPFNDADDDAANRALLAVCASRAWAAALSAGRPYPTAEALLTAADLALAALSEPDVDEALAAHPRIGDRAATVRSAQSAREQAGLAGADPAVLQALAEGNVAYQERFGQVYLVCATGRSAAELLAILQARLGNDAGTERVVVRAELAAINRIRLNRLLAG